MLDIVISKSWQTKYPDALMGIMVLNEVSNPAECIALDEKKTELEKHLRATISSRSDLESLPVIQAYNNYYKQFHKNYHVQFQVESIALKGKSIPKVAALVEAMFVAELKNMLLTAGHEVDKLEGPITLGISDGQESCLLMNGKEQTSKSGDMQMADSRGIISSIIYGPDKRTRITEQTRNALFTVYAPPGIEEVQVRQHLEDIKELVGLFSPELSVGRMEVFEAGGDLNNAG